MCLMLKTISDIGIVPVIKINDVSKAVPLAKALIDGGLPIAEITFRTDAAEASIKAVSEAFPDMLVGAGTVLTIEQAERAKNAGAKFIVSPGFNPKVVSWCLENDLLPTPGCTSPTEIEQALELGLKAVKFFPAEQSGGIDKIKALSAPYGNLKFIPTGGIGLDNLTKYITNKKILACGGSFMVKEDYINNNEWDKITELTKQAVTVMLGLEIGHIGINMPDEASAQDVTNEFAKIFGGIPVKNGNSSLFAGTLIEVMKSKGRGTHGHIAVKANSVDRALYHLSKQGVKFDMSTATYNDDGTMKVIFADGEFGGFAVHLLQK
ncbi:MAG: bifunctional 4-hydroxy-2-oxoglutarate aldolase/2-dehydro-3-deoxy-phosphogluconate aldolase [Bacillota bacterium]|nr:bifunctional 4-hydroxy-2-oxoglutarate aldolase/2-dehydro-3-deoxy-phosphogluconate aldolase [Bacillota bacterium]